MRRDLTLVLRSIALLAPLSAPLTLSHCARTQAASTSPEPVGSAAQRTECPSAAPRTDTACSPLQQRCEYREDNQRCLCAADGRWQCMSMVPTRGPLPPPDLPANVTPSGDPA